MKKKLNLTLLISVLFCIGIISLVIANDGENSTKETPSVDSETILNESDIQNKYMPQDSISQEKIKERIQEKIKERIQERVREEIKEFRYRRNITFFPWQKRNESECLEGCRCRGAVMVCPTENGKEITITAGRSGKTIIIRSVIGKSDDECKEGVEVCNESDDLTAETELQVEQEITEDNKTKIIVILSNGKKTHIKIMPDQAARRALERLRLKVCNETNNCTIQLKEVGKDNEKKASYDIQLERHSRILGIFKKKMKVRIIVEAENGEIIQIKKPWWAFIAIESAQ